MLPVWAATTYFFLVAYRSLRWQPAVLAGALAGASVLGKYWSVFLLAGLGLAAIIDRRRSQFFRSASPWIMTAAAIAVVTPHLEWLRLSEFSSFGYARARSTAPEDVFLFKDALYLVEALGYVVVPVLLVISMLRPSTAALKDMLWPQDEQRRLAAKVLALPLLLPALVSAAFGFLLTPFWTMPNWSLLPVMLLSSSKLDVPRGSLRTGLAAASALTLGAVVLSPVIALLLHVYAEPRVEQYAATVTAKAVEHWQLSTAKPLLVVAGDAALGPSVAYYLGERARYVGTDPTRARSLLARRGGVFVCEADDKSCVDSGDSATSLLPAAHRLEITAIRPLFGVPGPTLRYTLSIVPPHD
jgi:hypothetical protein